jgi:hypothetical protein
MTEFWESSFIEKQTMWGFEPTDSAIVTKDFFQVNTKRAAARSVNGAV